MVFCNVRIGFFISIHAPREGGDLIDQPAHLLCIVNFNPRPPRGGRQKEKEIFSDADIISIHAPREGGDMLLQPLLQPQNGISIHAPREGGDRSDGNGPVAPGGDFNPRPPRGGRQQRCTVLSVNL